MLQSFRRWPAVYLIVLATIAASFKGVFAKLAFLAGGTPWSVVVLRTLLAAPLFWWIAARSPSSPEPARRRDYVWAVLGAVLYLASATADLIAVQKVGAGASRVLLHTFPMFVLILEATRDRARPARATLWSFGLGWLGLAIMLWPTTDRPAGEVLAQIGADMGWSLAAAVLYATYLHFGVGSLRRLGSRRYTAWIHVGLVAVVLAVAPALYEPADSSALGIVAVFWVVVLVVLSTVPPVLLMLEGIRRTSAGYAGLVSQLGPMVGVLAAWALFDEALGPRKLIGAALVLLGVGLLRRSPRRNGG